MDVTTGTLPMDVAVPDNLTDWQLEALVDVEAPERNCLIEAWRNSPYIAGDVFCKAVWDGYSCWPDTPTNTTVDQPCPWTYPHNLTGVVGYRACGASGDWLSDKTNYSQCFQFPAALPAHLDNNQSMSHLRMQSQQPIPNLGTWTEEISGAIILRDIYFGGSIVSLILLVLTLSIFSYFKSLQCSRVTIHKHLVISFIVRSAVIVIMFEPLVTGRQYSYRNIDWMCKSLTAIVYYSMIANTAWMFVEALFLHARLTVSVFKKSDPLCAYYFIGWGLAIPIVISWAICMHIYNPNKCWNKSFEFPHSWIICVPILAFLTINALFLINIVRIIVRKLHADNNAYADHKIRTAARATLALFPLFGLTGILFSIEPKASVSILAYRIVNAVLQSSQGIFVSLIYCFFNKEVRTALSRKRQQCLQSRSVARQIRRSYAASISHADITNDMLGRCRPGRGRSLVCAAAADGCQGDSLDADAQRGSSPVVAAATPLQRLRCRSADIHPSPLRQLTDI